MESLYIMLESQNSRLPDWLLDVLIWLFTDTTRQEFVAVMIGLMAISVVIVWSYKYSKKRVKLYLNKEHVRTEFSTIFERVWRWLPFTKTSIEQYREMECTFDELEEKLQ